MNCSKVKIPEKPTHVTISIAMEGKALHLGIEASSQCDLWVIYVGWEIDPGIKRGEVRNQRPALVDVALHGRAWQMRFMECMPD